MPTTTIRVPRELHQRLLAHAESEHTTLAGAIEHALDVAEQAAFWAEAQATMGTPKAVAAAKADSAELAGSLKSGLDPDESWDDIL